MASSGRVGGAAGDRHPVDGEAHPAQPSSPPSASSPPAGANSLWVVPLIMWQLGRLIVCKQRD